MLKSGDIKYLRADVRANCLIFLDLCKQAGLPAKVTDTVRDDDYQRYLVSKGYAHKDAMRPTFHSVKAGLAFDICKDVAGHGYDDPTFFARCGQIGKQVGFSWGGRLEEIPRPPAFPVGQPPQTHREHDFGGQVSAGNGEVHGSGNV